MKSDYQGIWSSNLILSDIPFDYYLHPCPIFYAEELSNYGPTLWVNPPMRNPGKAKLFFKKKNLLIFTPIIFKRSSDDSGFGKLEVRLQVRIIASFFLGPPSSVWSISTAYSHLVEEYPRARSIFWTGDFFSPKQELKSYKEFDLLLCLTPITHNNIPKEFKGSKIHFHMCSQLSFKEKSPIPSKYFPSGSSDGRVFKKIVGYVGTLSDRRVDFDLLFYLIDSLSHVFFIIVGLGDGSKSTEKKISLLKNKSNVRLVEGVDYNDLPEIISEFDLGLIPYKTDNANVGTCPTKFIDYSSIGKPTISTKLPGLEKFGNLILIADSQDDFRIMIENFSAKGSTDASKLIKFASASAPHSFLRKFTKVLGTDN